MNKVKKVQNGCPTNGRHWFTKYNHPGVYLEKCVRCGAPNPRIKKVKSK